MAHKTEKEDAEFKITITLCVNCGVASKCTANNLCQKCLNSSVATTSSTTSAIAHVFVEKSFISSLERISTPAETSRDVGAVVPVKREVNRCTGCRRKVGLTGFRCRCGDLFCADHRYSDRHDCSYDYKAAGREAITRENPVVKAAKIVRI